MSDAVIESQAHADGKHQVADGEKEGQSSGPPSFTRQQTIGGHIAHDINPSLPSYHRKYANAEPLGMLSFAGTIFLLSLYNVGARGVPIPNGAVTLALGLGGLVQLCAGTLEFLSGNSYTATVFTSFSLFWFGWAMLYIPFFGITGTYDSTAGVYTATGTGALEIGEAFGMFHITWFTVACTLTIGSIRSSVAVLSWICSFDLTLLLLACSYWKPDNDKILTAAASLGIVCSFFSFYCAMGGLLTKESSYFLLPMGDLRRKE